MSFFSPQKYSQDILVVGASAGGVEALSSLVSQLPADFPASVFLVLHIPPEYPSQLPQILARYANMPVSHPKDGDKYGHGQIYVAAPDMHLLIDGDTIRMSRAPRENRFRPAIDVLFRSAARSCGPRVIGMILTGVLDDGSAGLHAIKSVGGKAIVQNPEDAQFDDMPRNAMNAVDVDHCIPLAEMGDLLSNMVNESAQNGDRPVSEDMELEVRIALDYNAFESGVMNLGQLTSYTCPECHGALAEISEGKIIRFRCHTGHAYSLNTLLVDVTQSIDASLWETLRTIEESRLLMEHLAGHLQKAGEHDSAGKALEKSEKAKDSAKIVRKLVLDNEILSKEKMGVAAEG